MERAVQIDNERMVNALQDQLLGNHVVHLRDYGAQAICESRARAMSSVSISMYRPLNVRCLIQPETHLWEK